MDLGFVGKVVVVTGASKGIGFACAEAFVREGAKVALVSRSDANLDAALARIQAAAHAPRKYVADLVRAEEAARVIDAVERDLGPIEVLVNSAGAARRYAPADLDAAAWHAAMDAKYFSYIHPIAAALPRMAGRGRGAIVNIIGSGGKDAEPGAPAGRRRQRCADAGDRGPRRRVRAERRADQRHQSRGHAHRSRAGRASPSRRR